MSSNLTCKKCNTLFTKDNLPDVWAKCQEKKCGLNKAKYMRRICAYFDVRPESMLPVVTGKIEIAPRETTYTGWKGGTREGTWDDYMGFC